MPSPVEVCLENRTGSTSHFTRCVALAGRQPGLRLDGDGEISWQRDDATAVEIWVSADDRLMAYRLPEAPAVRLERSGRTFDLPAERPVVLLTLDELCIGAQRLRLHVHGPAPTVQPPTALPARSRRAAKMAAVVALGAAVAGCSELEVRENPPEPTSTGTGAGTGGTGGAGGVGGSSDGGGVTGGGGSGGGGSASGGGTTTGGAGGGGGSDGGSGGSG